MSDWIEWIWLRFLEICYQSLWVDLILYKYDLDLYRLCQVDQTLVLWGIHYKGLQETWFCGSKRSTTKVGYLILHECESAARVKNLILREQTILHWFCRDGSKDNFSKELFDCFKARGFDVRTSLQFLGIKHLFIWKKSSNFFGELLVSEPLDFFSFFKLMKSTSWTLYL